MAIVRQEDSKLVLYMPNQLVSMDYNKLSRFQIEVFELMLQKSQNILKFEKDSVEKHPTSKRNIYSLRVDEILEYSSGIPTKKRIEELNDIINSIHTHVIKTYDKNILHSFSIFTEITADLNNGIIKFMLSDSMEACFLNGNKTVLGSMLEDKKTVGFTAYDLIELKDMQLKDYTRALFKALLKHYTFIEKNSSSDYGIIDYQIEEFRGVVGLENKYSRYSDLKTLVLDKIKEDLANHEVNIEFKETLFKRKVVKISVIVEKNEKFYELCEKLKKNWDVKLKKKKDTKKKDVKIKKEEDSWGESKLKVNQKIEDKINPFECDDFNPFEQKLPYELINKEKSELYLNTIIKDSQFSSLISMRICNAMNYDAYESLLLDNIDNKDVRNKVNSDEFARGYRFRYYKDVVECQDKSLIETEMIMLECLDVDVLQEIVNTNNYSRYKYLMDSFNLSTQSEKMFNKGFRSDFDENLF